MVSLGQDNVSAAERALDAAVEQIGAAVFALGEQHPLNFRLKRLAREVTTARGLIRPGANWAEHAEGANRKP